MESIAEQIQKLNLVFRSSSSELIPLKLFCKQLCSILKSNVYLFYEDGEIFCHAESSDFECPHNTQSLAEGVMPERFLSFYKNTDESVFNIYELHPKCTSAGIDNCIFNERYFSMIPIYSDQKRAAGILLIRYGAPFAPDEEVLCEYTAVIASLKLLLAARARIKEEAMEQAYSHLAVKSLSFSEQKAACSLISALKESPDGIIMLSVIANRAFVTRSAMTSAVKKLEGSGVIMTRPLGVKGKYIELCNRYLENDILEAINTQ